jgi:hypothetical protein
MAKGKGDSKKYWLADWLADTGVENTRALIKALLDDRKVAKAVEIASLAASQPAREVESADATALAGRRLDLSGLGTCSHPTCIQRQLDEGLSNIWQYFDQVVVEGLGPRQFAARANSLLYAREALLTHGSIYMHARQIGALPFMSFQEKPWAFCADHYKQHAREIGLPIALNGRVARTLVAKFEQEGSIEKKEMLNGYVAYYFRHPLFESGLFWLVPPEDRKKITAHAMAQEMYSNACIGTIGDVALAERLGCPLVSDAETVLPMHTRPEMDAQIDRVALSMRLPGLTGATSEQILRLKREHMPEFVKFRGAVIAAIRERIDRLDQDPRRVAADVQREFVAPAVADIEVRLKNSLSKMSTKAASGLALGAAMVTIGTLSGAPLVIGTGVATAASGAFDIKKYVEEKGDIGLSDMYFLWLAKRKVKRHRRKADDSRVADAFDALLAVQMLTHQEPTSAAQARTRPVQRRRPRSKERR